MTTETHASTFANLSSLGLITDALRRVFRGTPSLCLVGLMMLSAGCARTEVVPACADSDTIVSVEGMISTATIETSSKKLGGGKSESADMPKLSQVKEVGYASAKRQRGCVGTVAVGDAKMPYAYIVGPHPHKPSELAVMGADQAIVEARFSHIGADGNFSNNAEPVGRDNLGKALRAGVEALHKGSYPSHLRMREPMLPSARMRQVDPDRLREIAEIEPLGACSEMNAGTQYACRVLVERNDPMLAAIGMNSSMTLEGEFTFIRDAGGQQWRMSDDFPAAFMSAVLKARLLPANLPPDDAAAKK
jgi:hypothetical protein